MRTCTACGRGGVSKARVEFVIVAHMAGDPKSFCADSLMLEALDYRSINNVCVRVLLSVVRHRR